jgi:hypothetical protein
MLSFTSYAQDAAPAQDQPIAWKLVDERSFDGRKAKTEYLPLYVIEADDIGVGGAKKVINWHHYDDEPEVAYHPENEFLLDASRVKDRWIELTKEAPHTVKWQLVFVSTDDMCAVTLTSDGVIAGRDPDGKGIGITAGVEHTAVIERSGKTLIVTVDGDKKLVVDVEPIDRAPIRFTVHIHPVLLRQTRLVFGNDEKLSQPQAVPEVKTKPEWEVVYKENFNEKLSADNWQICPRGGMLEWKDEALSMAPVIEMGVEEVYALLKMSLPGDIRVSFRARSMMTGQPAFFGIMVFLKGTLEEEDGYFVEWNSWQVQMKKKNARVAGSAVGYPNVARDGGWMQFSMERVGSTLTMYTEGKEVLTWTDPHSLNDRDHDLFTFYSWRIPMEFDDVVIERNKLDLVKPNENHPVIPENYEHGVRHPVSEKEKEMVF